MNMIRDLARTIGRVLEQGINVSEETLFFAESTYGIAGEVLASVLRDDSFEGREALNELIFTPEPDVRVTIEPILADDGLGDAAIADIAAALFARFTSVDLIMPGSSKKYTIDVDPEKVQLFLKKLYLERSLDTRIVAVLTQTFSTDTVIGSRVMMRCRGDVLGDTKRAFLCRFITGSAAYESRFDKLLSITLMLLAEIEDEQPVEPYFLQKKRALITTLKEIRLFAGKRDHYPMEYLMMQRFKVPHESEEEVRNQLYLLTTVTDVILGLPPDPGSWIESEDLGTFDADTGIDNLIKALS